MLDTVEIPVTPVKLFEGGKGGSPGTLFYKSKRSSSQRGPLSNETWGFPRAILIGAISAAIDRVYSDLPLQKLFDYTVKMRFCAHGL